MNLEANRHQWYVRWFFWSLGILDEFRERETAWRYQDGINLCPMMRVMLVYAPIVLVLNLVVYGGALAALTVVPVHFYGWHSYLAILEVVAIAAVIIGLVVLVSKGLRALWIALQQAQAKRPKELEAPPVPKVEPAKSEPKGPGFWEVVRKYLAAIHDGLCPQITFKKEAV